MNAHLYVYFPVTIRLYNVKSIAVVYSTTIVFYYILTTISNENVKGSLSTPLNSSHCVTHEIKRTRVLQPYVQSSRPCEHRCPRHKP